MAENFDILLQLLLDKAKADATKKGIGTVTSAIKDQKRSVSDLSKIYGEQLTKGLKDAQKEFDNTVKAINKTKQAAASLQQISQTLFLAGSAIVGSIYLAAKREADRVIAAGGQVDDITARWIVANEKISASQQKIGRSAEVAFLPVLEKVAALAEKAAVFVEKNPELVSAALNIGVWTAGIGAIGLAVSKGIKLVADVKYLLAGAQFTIDSAIMKAAATQMFEAAVLMNKGGIVGKAGGIGAASATATGTGGAAAVGGAGAAAAAAATTVIALVVGSIIGKAFGQELTEIIYKDKNITQTFGDIAQTLFRIVALPNRLLVNALGDLGVISGETQGKLIGVTNSISRWIGEILGATGANDRMALSLQAEAKEKAEATQKTLEHANAVRNLTNISATASLYVARTGEALRGMVGNLASAGTAIAGFIQKIFNSASAGIKGGKSTTHDFTGYAYKQTYAMAQDGQRQFVMSGAATKAAEQMVGGQLNQQALLSGLAGGSRSAQYVDNSQYSGVTVQDIRKIRRISRQETLGALSKVLGR